MLHMLVASIQTFIVTFLKNMKFFTLIFFVHFHFLNGLMEFFAL